MADDPQNPYAPPATSSEAWSPNPSFTEAPPVPSSAPKVFGVLSIIFASIVLLFGLLASCGGLAGQGFSKVGGFGPQNSQTAQMREALSYMSTIYMAIGIQGLILTVMSSLLLAIGIGQLRYRRWAGAWSVYWAGLALVALAGMVALSFLLIGPAYQKMFDAIARGAPSGAIPTAFSGSMANIFGGTSGVMTVLFYAPYPILLLIFFTREHVRASMDR
jgi:hypothetical protein